jgi:hypothetical protein
LHRTSLLQRSSIVAAGVLAACLLPGIAAAQTWTPLTTQPSFPATNPLLLTDGTVMVQDIGSSGGGSANWWRLTPDNTGSYINGTWSKLASIPASFNYSPLFFASQVLTDGRVIINGGEYNGTGTGVWTTKGALYDPLANSWTNVVPPKGWTTIGDAQSTLLNDGTYMLANCCTTDEVTLNLATMAWTKTGTGKADINDEEGWTLLPSGQVLTVDAENSAHPTNTEILTSGSWASAGNTPQQLADPSSAELGPLVLRPNGTVFAVGATGANAVYNVGTKTWSKGPSFPKNGSTFYDSADGPAAVLPSGNVLVAASPGVFKAGLKLFEFDGKTLTETATIKNAAKDPSFVLRLLLLPTGQVLEVDNSKFMEIYTPTGTAKALWAPKIGKFAAKVTHGQSYTLTGKHLNGFTQAVFYGDDYQAATNFPIVRITNTATGHVFYARTANHSSMAVANSASVTTQVTIPSGIETGASTLEVVANGIASIPKAVTIN